MSTNQNILGVILAGIALKIENVGPIFPKFMSILAICSNRRQETVSVRKYNLNRSVIFSIQLKGRHVLAFEKDRK